MKFCVEKNASILVDPSEMNVFGGSNGGATGGYHKETKEMQIHDKPLLSSVRKGCASWLVAILSKCTRWNCGCVELRFNELTFSLCNAL